MGYQERKSTTAVPVSGVGLSRFVIMGRIITLMDKWPGSAGASGAVVDRRRS